MKVTHERNYRQERVVSTISDLPQLFQVRLPTRESCVQWVDYLSPTVYSHGNSLQITRLQSTVPLKLGNKEDPRDRYGFPKEGEID